MLLHLDYRKKMIIDDQDGCYHLLPGCLYKAPANSQLCWVDAELARILLHNLRITMMMMMMRIMWGFFTIVIIMGITTWTVSSKSSKSHSMLLKEFLSSVVAHSCSSPRLIVMMINSQWFCQEQQWYLWKQWWRWSWGRWREKPVLISSRPSFIESSRLGEGSHHLTVRHKTSLPGQWWQSDGKC